MIRRTHIHVPLVFDGNGTGADTRAGQPRGVAPAIVTKIDQSNAACAEASGLFHIYLDRLNCFHKLTDHMNGMLAADESISMARTNVDIAYESAVEAWRVYFQHCYKHGCPA